MNKYIFKTTATMKPHNSKKWWIDGDIIPDKQITADSVKDALQIYREMVDERHYISISDNALKHKSPMYIDTATGGGAVQVGFVITGKTEFQRDNGEWVTQFIDLWVEILTITETKF